MIILKYKYNAEEAAKFLGESVDSVKYLARTGIIGKVLARDVYLFEEIELLKYLAGMDFYFKNKRAA